MSTTTRRSPYPVLSDAALDHYIHVAHQRAVEIVQREFVSPATLRAYRRVCHMVGFDWIELLDFTREFIDNHSNGNA